MSIDAPTGPTCLNLACGNAYVTGPEWLNLDFAPYGRDVLAADLFGRLPVADGTMRLVYASHFLEHLPRRRVPGFLAECRRALKPGGILRIVVPDFEKACGRYLQARREGLHAQADYLMLEILDQAVRKTPGGDLLGFYRLVRERRDAAMRQYVYEQSGERIDAAPDATVPSWIDRVRHVLRTGYVRAVYRLLPAAFREQNVSLARVGELHAWMYDPHSLAQLLLAAGFTRVVVVDHNFSHDPTFPLDPLDRNPDGMPRKGTLSMYVEAFAPA